MRCASLSPTYSRPPATSTPCGRDSAHRRGSGSGLARAENGADDAGVQVDATDSMVLGLGTKRQPDVHVRPQVSASTSTRRTCEGIVLSYLLPTMSCRTNAAR